MTPLNEVHSRDVLEPLQIQVDFCAEIRISIQVLFRSEREQAYLSEISSRFVSNLFDATHFSVKGSLQNYGIF